MIFFSYIIPRNYIIKVVVCTALSIPLYCLLTVHDGRQQKPNQNDYYAYRTIRDNLRVKEVWIEYYWLSSFVFAHQLIIWKLIPKKRTYFFFCLAFDAWSLTLHRCIDMRVHWDILNGAYSCGLRKFKTFFHANPFFWILYI